MCLGHGSAFREVVSRSNKKGNVVLCKCYDVMPYE